MFFVADRYLDRLGPRNKEFWFSIKNERVILSTLITFSGIFIMIFESSLTV